MVGNEIAALLAKAGESEVLSAYRWIRADEFGKVRFPTEVPVVSVDIDSTDSMSFLLGYENWEVGTKKLVLTVLTGEKYGGGFCEDVAETVCAEILRMDEKKNIISVTAQRCVFDKTNFAFRITLTFGLREGAVIV